MSRIQLALNVTDLDSAVDFYSRMFDTAVSKLESGYANFEIKEPPLKLVLIESAEGGTLNHLGVETPAVAEVTEAEARLDAAGLATTGVDDTVCCFATKTETWVHDPDGAAWEWYVKTGDADRMRGEARTEEAASPCCAPADPHESRRPAAESVCC